MPTEEELRDAVGDILYELDQMRRAVELEGTDAVGGWEDHRSWLISEAGLLHARCLLEFLLTPLTIADETLGLCAQHYVPTFKGKDRHKVRRHLGGAVSDHEATLGPGAAQQLDEAGRDVRGRINRKVMHISLRRGTDDRVHLRPVAAGVERAWQLFLRRLPSEWRDGTFPDPN